MFVPVLTVVVPCHDEAAILETFHARLSSVMEAIGLSWDVLYVNDGSRDATLGILEAMSVRDAHVGFLHLSRNFGKEIALAAGLDHARATGAVVVIDADLQDPPELVPELVRVWREEGVDNVMAQRRRRAGDSAVKRLTSAGFYGVMRLLGGRYDFPADVGDFRVLSRRAVDALCGLREHHRMMKGLFAWIGFPSQVVLYDREPRGGGRSSWSWLRLLDLAIEGITGSSLVPLRLATCLGLICALCAVVYGGVIIVKTVVAGSSVPGYPSLMVVVLFLGGAQLVTIGVIGEYLGRVFNETKNRPLYLVEREVVSRSPADGLRPRL